jgi:hypothetical protein
MIIEKEMKFLNRDEAIGIVKEILETNPVYTKVNYLESLAKTKNPNISNRRQFREEFLSKILDWRNANSTAMTLIGEAVRYIEDTNVMQLYKPLHWNFIKLDDNIEFGFPFSLDKYIMLPQRVVQLQLQFGDKRKFITMLMHEQLHIHQRQHPVLYSHIFSKLGYINCTLLKIPSFIKSRLVHNPDENAENWIIISGKNYYWSALVLDKNLKTKRYVFPVTLVPSTTSSSTATTAEILPWFFIPSATSKWTSPQEFYAYKVSKELADTLF